MGEATPTRPVRGGGGGGSWGADGTAALRRGQPAPPPDASLPLGSGYRLSGNCVRCVENYDATMLECDLRNELPDLVVAGRKEPRKQREQKGLGTSVVRRRTWCLVLGVSGQSVLLVGTL